MHKIVNEFTTLSVAEEEYTLGTEQAVSSIPGSVGYISYRRIPCS